MIGATLLVVLTAIIIYFSLPFARMPRAVWMWRLERFHPAFPPSARYINSASTAEIKSVKPRRKSCWSLGLPRYFSRKTVPKPAPWSGTNSSAKEYAAQFNIEHFERIRCDKQIVYKADKVLQDRTLIKVLKRELPLEVLNEVHEAILSFLASEPKRKGRQNVNTWSFHLGVWTPRLGTKIVPTGDSYNIEGIDVVRRALISSGLLQLIDNIAIRHFKNLATKYIAVNGDPSAISEVFKTMALNLDGVAEPHIDGLDREDGMCLVVPLGNYEGGDLVFYDLGTRVELRPRDVIVFKSKELLHGNAPVSPDSMRFSLTFFTKQRDFYYQDPIIRVGMKYDEDEPDDGDFVPPMYTRQQIQQEIDRLQKLRN